MGLRAFYKRLELLEKLSPDGICQNPKCKGRCGPLEVHHIDGKKYCTSQLNRWTRVSKYWREYYAGVKLAAWGKKCNSGVHPWR